MLTEERPAQHRQKKYGVLKTRAMTNFSVFSKRGYGVTCFLRDSTRLHVKSLSKFRDTAWFSSQQHLRDNPPCVHALLQHKWENSLWQSPLTNVCTISKFVKIFVFQVKMFSLLSMCPCRIS